MKENRERIPLERIAEAIEKIEKYSRNLSYDQFVKNEQILDAILMQICRYRRNSE